MTATSSESLPYDAWLRRNPSHPGEFVSNWMEDSEGNHMPVAEAARKLGRVRSGAVPRAQRPSRHLGVAGLEAGSGGVGQGGCLAAQAGAYDLARERRRAGLWPEEPALASEAA